ncbi:MAG: hypothetical protein AAFV95_21325 [Bacteroidota bacterium]
MKTKLVFWGTNEQEEKILIAMALRAEENKVDVHIFTEAMATETFAQQLHDEWRNDGEVAFPEGYTTLERELTVSEPILPDTLKVDRADILSRAQTEWHFVVLSSKLNQVYQQELEVLKEKVDQLSKYDSKVWDSLKSFWSKVQEQVRERNLFKEHANSLRDNTNSLFSRLKELRSSLDAEFHRLSSEHFDTFSNSLGEMEEKIKEESKLQWVFEELKKMQRNFRDAKLTREHRSKIWERLDAAFKQVKEKRFGPNAGDNSPMERLKRRYDGLINAIQKMERSIQRDRDDLSFQNRKIEQTDGQLEAQIRQAKIKMIEERIRSKEEKLSEMMVTKGELEKRMENQAEKDRKREEKEKLEAARRAAKEKIKEEIKAREEARSTVENDKLNKAADAISGKEEEGTKEEAKAPETETLLGAVGATMGESLEDVVDTVKAVAEVVGDKIGAVVNEIKEEIKESVGEVKESVGEMVESVTGAGEEEAASKADDLKAIEGIGPKVEEVLNAADIKSFQTLAETSADRLKEILTAAGGNFASHNPTTWPQQAAMAAAGDWEKLKVWQDELIGGVVVAKSDDAKEEE